MTRFIVATMLHRGSIWPFGPLRVPSSARLALRILVLVVAIASLAMSATVNAGTASYELLFDLDRNASTGCSIAAPGGPISGIERAFVTTVTTGTSGASVTGIAQRVCVEGVLGPPVTVDAGGWPIGFGNGIAGTAVVETFVDKNLLGGGRNARVYLLASGNGDSDAIVAGLDGTPLELELGDTRSAPPVTIPTHSPYALFALVALVCLLAMRSLRGRGAGAAVALVCLTFGATALVWAATVLLDGQIGDWSGIAPLARNPKGNAAKNADVTALFYQHDATRAYFRIDADIELDATANQAPVVNAGVDQTITLPANANLAGSATDDGLPNPPAGLTLTWNKVSGPGVVAFASATSASTTAVFSLAGTYILRLTASDGALSAADDVRITVAPPNSSNAPPVVDAGPDQTITLPGTANLAASASDDGLPSPPGKLTLAWSAVSGPGLVTFGVATSSSTTASFAVAGVYVLRLTASDGSLSTSDDVQITVNPGDLPPTIVATKIDPTVPTTLFNSTAFIYTGPDAVQTGVATGTITARRAAVVRGNVLQKSGAPLDGATVTIVGHPEFGTTKSRADGVFDMAVNGGGRLTVRYERPGYLPAQRQVATFPKEFALAPDVVLLQRDTQATTIDFSGMTTGMQVARGSVQTDVDGTRRATVLIPAGTTAALVQSDGSTRPASSLTLRFTEYTVGSNGRQAMPAQLPPASLYTYAVELGADEAVAKVDGRDVVFNRPVILHVENFLDVPTGEIVPVGYYDPKRGAWIGAPNGQVIRVVGVGGGLADLDVDGDGRPDEAATLLALGIDDAERRQLALLYAPGTGLWRAPLAHFSTFDLNYPYVCVPDGCTPPEEPPPPPKKCGKNGAAGSLIGCEPQTLGEGVDLVGVPFSLHYDSSRVPGRTEESVVRVTLGSGGAPAGSLVNEIEILVAGRSLRRTLAAGTTQTLVEWDGKDAYGRDVRGSQPAVIRIGYTYRAAQASAPREPSAWGQLSGVRMSAGRDRDGSTLTLWQERVGTLTRLDARAGGLGGWTLSELHTYDALGGVIHLGNGTQSESASLFGTNSGTIRTIAGGGTSTGDGVPATEALLTQPFRLAVGPDASVYFVDPLEHVVRRVTANGVIDTVAGTRGVVGFLGDGGPATQARLSEPIDIAIAADGSLYIVDFGNFRVRRVDTDGIITTIAGNGNPLWSGDNGPATQAGMLPRSLAVGPDNNVYIGADNRIRVVDGAGIIKPYAATGEFGFSGDGGPARNAHLSGTPEGLAFGPDGSLYLTDASRIRQVSPQGIIKTVAGSTTVLFSGDGALATSAGIDPHGVAVDRDGAIYIADRGNSRVRRVGSDGIIRTVAGNGEGAGEPDGALATRVSLPVVTGVAAGSNGRLYVIDPGEAVIRRIDPVLPADATNDVLLPSGDGSEVYVFDANGRHLRTLDGFTGATRLSFTYDADGYPVSITDADGNVTTIERSGSLASAIVAPGGQRTSLATDANGWLARVTNPASEARNMEYSAQGLLLRFSDPRGNVSRFTYDGFGRLTRDEDAAGGSTDLARTDQATGYTITTTSALGRVRKFQVEGLPGGEVRQVVTEPGGEKVVTVIATDGRLETTDAAGTVSTVEYGPDPRWGMLVPVTIETIVTPGGRSRTIETTRSATLGNPGDLFSLTSFVERIIDNGDTTTSEYDPVQRSFTFTSPGQRTGTIHIDAVGRIVREQIAGLAPTAYAYSSAGLLTSIAMGAGTQRKAAFAYDALRQLTQATDPLGRTTRFAYDAVQRPILQTLADGRTIAASYDASGNIASLTPPSRAAHAFDHSVVDLLTRYNPPDLAGVGNDESSIVYDADRQATSLALPDGRTVSRIYDNGGRLASTAFSRGRIDVSYDPASGLPVRVDAPGGVRHAFAFDGSLLLSDSVSGPVAGTIGYEYDDKFRVVGVSVNGDAVARAYEDNLLVQAGALALTRRSDNGLIASSTINAVSEAIDYDEFAGVLDQRVRFNATDVYRAQFTRDALGRATRKVETIGNVTDTYDYAYDVAGRLVAVTRNGVASAAYAYDGNSNRTSYAGLLGSVPAAQVEVDAQDRLTRYGANAYTYDANGTLATKVTAAGTTTYSYDELGNLTRVALPDGTVVDYVIDGLQRRIAKRRNGVLVRQWLWDGPTRIAAELDGAGALVSRFVHATRRNAPDYVVRGGVEYRLVTDQNGSPRLMVDSVTGTIAGSMNHDEFGRVVADSLSGLVPFGYAGGLYDPDTGLVRFGARDYDPETGRWTSKDPQLFEGQDTNLYAYVYNDPLTLVDPTGLQGAVLNLVPSGGRGGAGANNQAIQQAIQKYTSPDDTFTVFAHCNGGCQDESGKSMSAEELGKKIEHSDGFDRSKHKKVRIAGCRVKSKYAQQLKDYLERQGAGKETIEYSGPDQKVFPDSKTGNLQQSFNNSQPIRWQTLP
jgi:RHS repeat-associated protein